MKKKFLFLFIVLFMLVSLPAKSIDIMDKLSKIGFNLFSEKDAKIEIAKIIEKQQKYANKKNIVKFRALYSDDFMSYDGVVLDKYIEEVKKVWDISEKNLYSIAVNSIVVQGDYATVEVSGMVSVNTKDSYENIEGKGLLESTSRSIYYFKKIDGEWKISAENTYSEKAKLSYGIAKETEIDIIAPESVINGEQYNVKVKVLPKNNEAVVASITAEEIQQPQVKKEEIYRSIKKDGELERILVANSDGKNEVAFASIALVNPVINSNGEINAEIKGVCFITSKVNVVLKKEKKDE